MLKSCLARSRRLRKVTLFHPTVVRQLVLVKCKQTPNLKVQVRRTDNRFGAQAHHQLLAKRFRLIYP